MLTKEIRLKGSKELFSSLPVGYSKECADLTGFSQSKIEHGLKGVTRTVLDPEFLKTSVKIAELHMEFRTKMFELLKPFKNAKANKARK